MAPVRLFPIFLKLAGRRCLVVGAGTVGEPKIESLLRAGASVRVVAPQATRRVHAWARAGRVDWEERRFRAMDLEGVFLVVAATSSPRLHERILRQARRQGVLCNVVDDPRRCDFFYPAVVRRGSLQIAVSTGGSSPALAQRLRKELEKQFGPAYGAWVEQLGKDRRKLLRRQLQPERRRLLSHRLASRSAFHAFASKRKDAGRARGIS